MKQVQINRKHMLDATLGYLDLNADIWQSIAKIGQVKNQLSEKSLDIDTAAMQQEKTQVNVGKVKLALKRTMCDKADIVNDLLEVYAIMNGKDRLAEKMADSASDLFRMKNDDMLRRVKIIIDSALKHRDDLVAEYGLTEEQIADLQADYDRYLELNGQPREYIIKTGMATQNLEILFSEVNDLLCNHLDNLLKVFKRRNPAFYNGYLKARIVVDY